MIELYHTVYCCVYSTNVREYLVPVLYDCTRPGTLYYVPYSRYYADAATNKLLCVYRS